VFWTLPNNYPVAMAAVNQGLSIQDCDPRSDIAKSYSGLTEAVVDSFTVSGSARLANEDDKRSGILGRLMPMRSLVR
jgi:hypothetical protein